MSETPPKATWPPQQDELVYEPKEGASHKLSRRQTIYMVLGVLMLAIGIGLGLLYTWGIDPVIEQNTRPDQLSAEGKQQYVVAIALDYGETGDLERAYQLLGEVEPGTNPFQVAANTLCSMTQSGQVQTAADIQAMRQLIALINPQPDIEVECDTSVYATLAPSPVVTIIPTFTPTATTRPVATKTSSPDGPTPTAILNFGTPTQPTSPRDFDVSRPTVFCDEERSGLIIVKVVDENGFPLPGIEVAVNWLDVRGQREERFFTGLKPELGTGYADFKMSPDQSYQVSLVGRSSLSERMDANECNTGSGTIISYQVTFESTGD